MTTVPSDVLRWLLAGDPGVRWQALRDLTDASPEEVADARAAVATEGAGARLLALQAADGRWGGAAWNRGFDSTMHALTLLRELGLDPASAPARRALDRVEAHVTWAGCGPPECASHGFFQGETEPCINGQVAASGAAFGRDVDGLVARLLDEQLADGGWNCEAEYGSTRSSYHSTICVLDALAERERQGGANSAVSAALERAHEYLLERHLFRRRSTGAPIDVDRKLGPGAPTDPPAFTRLAFPTWWHYDVLRGLDHLRAAGVPADERTADAVALVAEKRDADGVWREEVRYPGTPAVELDGPDGGEGRPSRWITLRALRVLAWSRGES